MSIHHRQCECVTCVDPIPYKGFSYYNSILNIAQSTPIELKVTLSIESEIVDPIEMLRQS